jgi:hypothetical protein
VDNLLGAWGAAKETKKKENLPIVNREVDVILG